MIRIVRESEEDANRRMEIYRKATEIYDSDEEIARGLARTFQNALGDLTQFEGWREFFRNVMLDLPVEGLQGIMSELKDINEDVVKKSNGKWTNRGDDGQEHGEFDTREQALKQMRAMYTSGYKGK